MRILLLILLILPFAHAADLEGSGFYQTKNSRQNCSRISFSYERFQDSLIIHGGHYNCSRLTGQYLYRELFIKGNSLIENGQVMGSIDDKKIVVKSPTDPDYELFIQGYNGRTFVIESRINTSKMNILVAELQ